MVGAIRSENYRLSFNAAIDSPQRPRFDSSESNAFIKVSPLKKKSSIDALNIEDYQHKKRKMVYKSKKNVGEARKTGYFNPMIKLTVDMHKVCSEQFKDI